MTLRPLTFDDFDELASLQAEESFWKYPLRRGYSDTETRAFLERVQVRYAKERFAMSAVVVREGNLLAGWAGLAAPTFLPEVLPAVEVGWRLGTAFRGHGYATEAGRAWIDYGFGEGGLNEIVSIYEPENVASGAVMARLGFSFAKETAHPERGEQLHVMKLGRDDWLASRARGADAG